MWGQKFQKLDKLSGLKTLYNNAKGSDRLPTIWSKERIKKRTLQNLDQRWRGSSRTFPEDLPIFKTLQLKVSFLEARQLNIVIPSVIAVSAGVSS